MTSDNNNKYVDALKDINFCEWQRISKDHSECPLGSSSRTALTKIREIKINGKNLLAGIESQSPEELTKFTTKELVNLIKKTINSFVFDDNDIDNHDFEKLGDIFDLIHVWGGWSGRSPYVNSESRLHPNKWQGFYLEGARLAKIQKYEEALKEFEKIKGIGTSFASKHLRFWSDKFPILDVRISLILRGVKTPTCGNYKENLRILKDLGNCWGCSPIRAEEIIYTFSTYYFQGNELEINDTIKPKICSFVVEQQKIAQEIIDIKKPPRPKKS